MRNQSRVVLFTFINLVPLFFAQAQVSCKTVIQKLKKQGIEISEISRAHSNHLNRAFESAKEMGPWERPVTQIQYSRQGHKEVSSIEMRFLVPESELPKTNSNSRDGYYLRVSGTLVERLAVSFTQEEVPNPHPKDGEYHTKKIYYMSALEIPKGNKIALTLNHLNPDNVSQYQINAHPDSVFSTGPSEGIKIVRHLKVPSEKLFKVRTEKDLVFFEMVTLSGETVNFAFGKIGGELGLYIKPGNSKTWKKISSDLDQLTFDNFKKAPTTRLPEATQVKSKAADISVQYALNAAMKGFFNLSKDSEQPRGRLGGLIPTFDRYKTSISLPGLAPTTLVDRFFPDFMPYSKSQNVFLNFTEGRLILHMAKTATLPSHGKYIQLTDRQYADLNRVFLTEVNETFLNGFSYNNRVFYTVVKNNSDGTTTTHQYCFDVFTNSIYELRGDQKWYHKKMSSELPETHFRSRQSFEIPAEPTDGNPGIESMFNHYLPGSPTVD